MRSFATPPPGRRAAPAADTVEPLSDADIRRRAVAHLARREHSRTELAARLEHSGADRATVRSVLDALAGAGLLSDQRFAESLLRARQPRYGSARVAGELRARGVDPAAAGLLDQLRAGDAESAAAIWRRKFGVAPDGPVERARQMRFLQARGFPLDVIRRVVPATSRPDPS
jgi:regulatory protein